MTADGPVPDVPAWTLGDYPCQEEGFPPGDRCGEASCGEAAARAELLALYRAMFVAARAEPTTWETVASVRRFEGRIATVEALLDGGLL